MSEVENNLRRMIMAHEIEFNFKDETLRFRIKEGWDRCGAVGEYFGFIYVNTVKWAIVLFDDEEDPDMHKADGIEIETKTWKELK